MHVFDRTINTSQNGIVIIPQYKMKDSCRNSLYIYHSWKNSDMFKSPYLELSVVNYCFCPMVTFELALGVFLFSVMIKSMVSERGTLLLISEHHQPKKNNIHTITDCQNEWSASSIRNKLSLGLTLHMIKFTW